MTIELTDNEPPIKHDRLVEITKVMVAARISDDGEPQIGLIFNDQDGDAYGVHAMSLEDAAEFARLVVTMVNRLKT